MEKIIVEKNFATCLRCDNQWFPVVETPKFCRFCKSPYWNKEKRIKDKYGSNKYGFDKIQIGVETFFPFPLNQDGTLNKEAAHRRALSLDQYMRRRGYAWTWRGIGSGLFVMRRT